MDAWEEGKQPRADNGQFGSGGGAADPYDDVGKLNPATMPEGHQRPSFQFVGDTKAQEVLDKTTALQPDWRYIDPEKWPVEEVPLSSIRSMQPSVENSTVEKYGRGEGDQRHPVVSKIDGVYYILNGTHRTEAKARAGAKTIKVHVVNDKIKL